jgi:hypothetical protein
MIFTAQPAYYVPRPRNETQQSFEAMRREFVTPDGTGFLGVEFRGDGIKITVRGLVSLKVEYTFIDDMSNPSCMLCKACILCMQHYSQGNEIWGNRVWNSVGEVRHVGTLKQRQNIMQQIAKDLLTYLFQVLSRFGDRSQEYACWYRSYGRNVGNKDGYQKEITRIIINSFMHSPVYLRPDDFQLFQYGDANV